MWQNKPCWRHYKNVVQSSSLHRNPVLALFKILRSPRPPKLRQYPSLQAALLQNPPFLKLAILSILSHSSIKNISRPSTIPATRSSTAKVFSTPLTLISRSSPAISTPRLSTANHLEPRQHLSSQVFIIFNLSSHYQDLQQIKPNSILSTILSTPATSTRFNKPTVSNATSQPRSYDLLIYLSTSISTILILMIV